jgi:hypothetical protein
MTENPEAVPTSLDERAKRVLVNYTREMADRMGLRDWSFDIASGEPSEGSIASTEVWGSSSTATIWIGDKFWKYGPLMMRETVCHELVHWHTDKFFKAGREVMRRTLGREAYELSLDHYRAFHELTVDGIAAAWAREFPLIDWTADKPLYTGYEDEHDDNTGRPPKSTFVE